MGMEAAFDFLDPISSSDVDELLEYFYSIDELFSPYKKTSDIYKVNAKKIAAEESNPEVRKVLRICERLKKDSNGFFDIRVENHIDPSGMVKGYAISQAAHDLSKKGYFNFYIEIGGDMQVAGLKNGFKWKVGVENAVTGKIHVIQLTDKGVATAGLFKSGLPIYNPHTQKIAGYYKSVTVIARDVADADWIATAAFAMGEKGKAFVENREGIEAIFIGSDGSEFFTSGIANYM